MGKGSDEVVKIFYRGDCLAAAFYSAGYKDLNISPWFEGQDLKPLCESLQLRLHSQESNGSIEADTPVIAIYQRGGGIAHAEFAPNLGPIIRRGEKLIAVIELPQPKR